MNEQAAIERCQAGDHESFRPIVEQYQVEALGHAVAILRSREDAADAVQEAFVRAFQALDRFRTGQRFYPWFYAILRNCCYKLAARRRSSDTATRGLVSVLAAGTNEVDERTRWLETALEQLSDEDRELVTLKHLDGLSYAELAERLGVPAGTVMSRLYHARLQLRHKVERLRKKEV